MYILGIDPGTGRTGWGIIKFKKPEEIIYVAHGCIVTKKESFMQDRLLSLHNSLSEIIEKYKPHQVAVEQIFFGMNSKTAISVSQARGVVLMTMAKYQVPFFEYTSISVKHFLTGNGRAEKKDMQSLVRKLLSKNVRSLPFSSKDKAFDDAADALAIAIHHTWKYSSLEDNFSNTVKTDSTKTKKASRKIKINK